MNLLKKIILCFSIALMGCGGSDNPNRSVEVDGDAHLCAGPIYKNQDLTGRDFSGRNLSCADFSGSILTRVKFDKANLYAANFIKTIGTGVSFKRPYLLMQFLKMQRCGAVIFKTQFWWKLYLMAQPYRGHLLEMLQVRV